MLKRSEFTCSTPTEHRTRLAAALAFNDNEQNPRAEAVSDCQEGDRANIRWHPHEHRDAIFGGIFFDERSNRARDSLKACSHPLKDSNGSGWEVITRLLPLEFIKQWRTEFGPGQAWRSMCDLDSAMSKRNAHSTSPNRISCDSLSYPPRGLSHEEAARYVGVGRTKFDELVADGRMPKPVRIDGRVLWDRIKLDAFFTDLADDLPNPLDRMGGPT
jgi:excisionase family DNA binding protein